MSFTYTLHARVHAWLHSNPTVNYATWQRCMQACTKTCWSKVRSIHTLVILRSSIDDLVRLKTKLWSGQNDWYLYSYKLSSQLKNILELLEPQIAKIYYIEFYIYLNTVIILYSILLQILQFDWLLYSLSIPRYSVKRNMWIFVKSKMSSETRFWIIFCDIFVFYLWFY